MWLTTGHHRQTLSNTTRSSEVDITKYYMVMISVITPPKYCLSSSPSNTVCHHSCTRCHLQLRLGNKTRQERYYSHSMHTHSVASNHTRGYSIEEVLANSRYVCARVREGWLVPLSGSIKCTQSNTPLWKITTAVLLRKRIFILYMKLSQGQYFMNHGQNNCTWLILQLLQKVQPWR